MAEQPQQLKWIHARGWQAVFAVVVLVGVVFVVLSAVTPGSFAVGPLLSTVGIAALGISSALGRRQITGRW